MTRVGFYVVQAAESGQRLHVAARLADKAYARGHRVYINAADKPQDPGKHTDLLINLQLDIPAFFSRFARVAEVVTQDATSLQALRSSWRFYQERGYQLEKHDL